MGFVEVSVQQVALNRVLVELATSNKLPEVMQKTVKIRISLLKCLSWQFFLQNKP